MTPAEEVSNLISTLGADMSESEYVDFLSEVKDDVEVLLDAALLDGERDEEEAEEEGGY
jgi:hypothetical protein